MQFRSVREAIDQQLIDVPQIAEPEPLLEALTVRQLFIIHGLSAGVGRAALHKVLGISLSRINKDLEEAYPLIDAPSCGAATRTLYAHGIFQRRPKGSFTPTVDRTRLLRANLPLLPADVDVGRRPVAEQAALIRQGMRVIE